MAAFYLIATLMVLQGLFVSYSMAAMEGSGGDDDMTTEITPTPSQMMSTPSSIVVTRSQGPNVTLILKVSINCSGDNLMKLSKSLEDDIEEIYQTAALPNHTVNVMGSCEDELERFGAIITLSFYTGIPSGKTIKGVFEYALACGEFTNLTSSNTNFTIKFSGETSCSGVMSTPTVTCSNTLPTTVQATPPLGGTETTAMKGDTVTTAMKGDTVTTVMKGDTVTTAPQKEPGPTVILILIVTTNCSAYNLLALKVSVQNDVNSLYKIEGFPIKSVIIQGISCNPPINITLKISFYSGIPSGETIKGVFQAALKGGKITNLTESNTVLTVTFTGVTIKYNPKAGQCQAIHDETQIDPAASRHGCGVGGALIVERVCTPENMCKGIEPEEKEEEGHCPKEEKGTCTDECDDDDGSGGIHNSPSYALVTLLAVAMFTKTMFS